MTKFAAGIELYLLQYELSEVLNSVFFIWEQPWYKNFVSPFMVEVKTICHNPRFSIETIFVEFKIDLKNEIGREIFLQPCQFNWNKIIN